MFSCSIKLIVDKWEGFLISSLAHTSKPFAQNSNKCRNKSYLKADDRFATIKDVPSSVKKKKIMKKHEATEKI